MSNADAFPHLPEFAYLPSFVRAGKGVLTEEDYRAIELVLVNDPTAGDLMAQTGGVRKVRYGRSGRGKSGDLRVVYYYRSMVGRIYLLTVFGKNEQANLTAAQKQMMKQLTAALDAE